MDEARMVRVSKYLSKYLRHQPEQLGLELEPGGWVPVEKLLAACARAGMRITREELDEVVARNNKQRFGFDESGERIRAKQGHSVVVDLQLDPIAPPDVLYHGTSRKSVEPILREGLRKMQRHHVHLSADIATALVVGRRHGPAVVFSVETAAMHADGHVFYRSDNGVWLVDRVPSRYLHLLDAAG